MTFRDEYELAEKNNTKRTLKHLKNLTRWRTRVFVKRNLDEELSCQLCDSKENIICHHTDYCEPYLVNTLCHDCHMRVHKMEIKIKPIDLTKLKLKPKDSNKDKRRQATYCEERLWLKDYLKVENVQDAFREYGGCGRDEIGAETLRLIMTTCYKPGKKTLKLLNERFGIPEEKFDIGYRKWKINKLFEELDKLM